MNNAGVSIPTQGYMTPRTRAFCLRKIAVSGFSPAGESCSQSGELCGVHGKIDDSVQVVDCGIKIEYSAAEDGLISNRYEVEMNRIVIMQFPDD